MRTMNSEQQLEADLVDKVVELGFYEVWEIPAPVAVAWLRHVVGPHFSAEDVTRDSLLSTLSDYIGQFSSSVDVLKTAAQETYPHISFERFPYNHINWEAAAEDYMKHGVLVIGDGHYFDRFHSAFALEDIV